MKALGGSWPVLAAGLAAAALAGCGGGDKSQDANEPEGTFPVNVVEASFPANQRLAQKSQLVITVQNSGDKTVPNVAVTVEAGGADQTHSAAAFAEASQQPGLADPSRPVWVLDEAPRGGVTAYTNTWALGSLRPGQTKRFVWQVTAVKAGVHAVRYRVAAGLDGKAKAVDQRGQPPEGQFNVRISNRPADARVGDDGQVITSPQD
jgi:hypothetical protein